MTYWELFGLNSHLLVYLHELIRLLHQILSQLEKVVYDLVNILAVQSHLHQHSSYSQKFKKHACSCILQCSFSEFNAELWKKKEWDVLCQCDYVMMLRRNDFSSGRQYIKLNGEPHDEHKCIGGCPSAQGLALFYSAWPSSIQNLHQWHRCKAVVLNC